YIPNKDRHGKEIGNQRKWVLQAIRLLSEINGGATAMPPVEGGWLGELGEIIWENPVIVYSFIRPDPFLSSLARLRRGSSQGGAMTKRIRTSETTFPSIRDTAASLPRIDPAQVREQLGAEELAVELARALAPVTL